MQSVVSYPDRGRWGDNRYRGNCSGRLIEDIIRQYKVDNLCDFMVGGGTTEDVCRDMEVEGTYADLNRGYDMMTMDIPARAGNIFWHPPYGSMITYSDNMYSAKEIEDRYGFDPRVNDLSRCRDWDDFIRKLNWCCMKQFAALDKGGRMFILMGDWKQKGRLYSMLTDIAKPGTMEQIIIKMQHNCTSDSNTYSNMNFVPIVHEYLLVLRKGQGLIVPVEYAVKRSLDMRDSMGATWRDVVHAVLEDEGREMSLSELYEAIAPYRKAKVNANWQAKVRQTVQDERYFKRTSRGHYEAA